MFGLGLSEIALILIIIIMITNPKDYPKIIRSIAKNYQKVSQFKTELIRELNILDIDENSQKDSDSIYYKSNRNKEYSNDENSKSST